MGGPYEVEYDTDGEPTARLALGPLHFVNRPGHSIASRFSRRSTLEQPRRSDRLGTAWPCDGRAVQTGGEGQNVPGLDDGQTEPSPIGEVAEVSPKLAR